MGDVKIEGGSPVVRVPRDLDLKEVLPTRIVGSPVIGTVAPKIELKGSIRRLDGDQPTTVALPSSASENLEALDIDLKLAHAEIDPKGVPVPNTGHCAFVRPFIGKDNWLLTGIDTVYDHAFKGVGRVDQFFLKDGIDEVTHVNGIPQPYQNYARWGERAVGAAGITGLAYYAQTRNPALAIQKTGAFWQKNWPLGLAVFLTGTEILSHASKWLDLVDPDRKTFRGETRDIARWVTYGAMYLGAIYLLNFSPDHSYRQVNAPKPTPANAKPMGMWAGLAFAAFYMAYDWYWSNASAQERILTSPLYNEPPGTGLYAIFTPWNFTKWQPEFLQAHTSAAHGVAWASFVAVWGALLGWQTGATDRITNNPLTRRLGIAFDSKALPIVEGSWEYRAIHDHWWSRYGFTRGAVSSALRIFTPKRFAYTAISTAIGLPVGIGIGRAMEQAQAYGSKEAVSGTPFRALITAPLSAAGTTYFTAANGFSRAWEGYTFNMIPVNYTWAACSKMGENVFQVVRGLADDYKSSDDPNEKRHLRTQLFNLYKIAYDSGDERENEKLKIKTILADAGIPVEAINERVGRYATPPPPALK